MKNLIVVFIGILVLNVTNFSQLRDVPVQAEVSVNAEMYDKFSADVSMLIPESGNKGGMLLAINGSGKDVYLTMHAQHRFVQSKSFTLWVGVQFMTAQNRETGTIVNNTSLGPVVDASYQTGMLKFKSSLYVGKHINVQPSEHKSNTVMLNVMTGFTTYQWLDIFAGASITRLYGETSVQPRLEWRLLIQ